MSKVVRPQAKGMVTIPIEFRKKLGINENSLLEAKLTDCGVTFIKIDFRQESELFTDTEIKEWMKEDKLDKKTIKKLEKLLKRNN